MTGKVYYFEHKLTTDYMSIGITARKIKVNMKSILTALTKIIEKGVPFTLSALWKGDFNSAQDAWYYKSEGAFYNNDQLSKYGDPAYIGDVVGVFHDIGKGTLSFTINGKSLGVAVQDDRLKKMTDLSAFGASYHEQEEDAMKATDQLRTHDSEEEAARVGGAAASSTPAAEARWRRSAPTQECCSTLVHHSGPVLCSGGEAA